MWRLFWRIELIKETEDHSDSYIYFLRFTHRFNKSKYIHIHKMTSQMVMEYDWNKKEYEKKIYSELKRYVRNKRSR